MTSRCCNIAYLWYTDAYTRQLCCTSLRNSTSHLLSRPISVSAPLHHHHLSSDAPIIQPSAVELFWLLLPDCGTLFRRTSRQRRQCLFLENAWKTHLFSHSFPKFPVVPVQWLCHFGPHSRSFFTYLLTYLPPTWRLCCCWRNVFHV